MIELTIVVDTSIIINGEIIPYISDTLSGSQLIIPQVVIDELQSQAISKKAQGFVGLENLKHIHTLATKCGIDIVISGNHPSSEEIRLADMGRLDGIIVDLAKKENATLYTSDTVQSLVAQAQGVKTIFVAPKPQGDLEFVKFFDSNTMSVHLKQGQRPLAKRGRPGSSSLDIIQDEPHSKEYLEMIVSQILDVAHSDSNTIEISKLGASVVQHDNYRIAITRPPLSESLEITIVHPTVQLSLDDYSLSEKMLERLTDRAEGVVISGAPGSGKSTLASGIANFYHRQGKIVKTFESPRDLQVDSGITQYGKLDGSFDNTADMLLLVRPDYTIFDEVRRREDFRTFADLRLTGVGMVGVVHANSPLDAIQRFIGKIELGMIPSILDTVIFVKNGMIDKVYELALKVKVPSGMTESDLARPVIEIQDFESGKLEYEIYTFGEENVIVPVYDEERFGIEGITEEKIREVFARYDPHVKVHIRSKNRAQVVVDEQYIPSIIGRGGSNITDLEKQLHIRIDVVSRQDSPTHDTDIPFQLTESKTMLMLTVSRQYSSMRALLYLDDTLLTSVKIGRRGRIKIPKRSETARKITYMPDSLKVLLRDS